MNPVFSFGFLAVTEEQFERGIKNSLTTKLLNAITGSA
jgi:hypothetical protein